MPINSRMPNGMSGRPSFNLAVVCGDGLPVSGLLTTFRNVVDLIKVTSGCPQLINLPIPVDLGYSWRPDKEAFFPRGPSNPCYPPWFSVTRATPVQYDGYEEELLAIRREVAQPDSLSLNQKQLLRRRIEAVTSPYQKHFEEWFDAHDVDWVCAINMTLSDSVSVSSALHRAAETRWGNGRPGGVLFWEHDLLKSYAVHENNERVYPPIPNEFTPVPQDCDWHVWSVVSDLLAPETKHYPTKLSPLVVPNLLPIIPHQTPCFEGQNIISNFLSRIGILDGVKSGRRVLLCPVRIFPVKGIEISIRLFGAIKKLCQKRNISTPYMLIFGDPKEDTKYAAELKTQSDDENVSDDIRFLGGVPICTGVYEGVPKLDEKDLLSISAVTNGGVLFTPRTADVESVGLGPALASIAGIPCVVTRFDALHEVYSDGLHCVHVDVGSQEGFDEAARAFVDFISSQARGEKGSAWIKMAQDNKKLMLKTFPSRPWKDLLLQLATKAAVCEEIISAATVAFE